MEMPDPAPWSGNADVVQIWNGHSKGVDNTRTAPNDDSLNVVQNVSSINEAMKADMGTEGIKEVSQEAKPTESGSFDNDIAELMSSKPVEEDVPKTDTGVPLVGIVDEDKGPDIPKTDEGKPLVDVLDNNAKTEEPELVQEESAISEPVIEEEKESDGFAVPELIDNTAFTESSEDKGIDELKLDDDDDSSDPEDFS